MNRSNHFRQAWIFLLTVLISSASLLASESDKDSMLLGNPSNAKADPSDKDNYLMVKKFFALSYNNSLGEPNWVSWSLTKEDLGTAPRKPQFSVDDTLPHSFTTVQPTDYKASGFDRGHMCPHSDRAADKEMSFATFIMTNIIPQSPNCNRKAWEQLEQYSRDLATAHHHLFIVSGPGGTGGSGENGKMDSLAGGKVRVPAVCWKIVVVVPEEGPEDLSKINADTRVIAVIMPNDQTLGDEWGYLRTSVSEIERQTGLKFFDKLPPDVAAALKAKVDKEVLPAVVPRDYSKKPGENSEVEPAAAVAPGSTPAPAVAPASPGATTWTFTPTFTDPSPPGSQAPPKHDPQPVPVAPTEPAPTSGATPEPPK